MPSSAAAAPSLPTKSQRDSLSAACAGVQSYKLPLHIEGAPNFRSVAGQHVFGSAMPALEGMKRVLDHVGCSPTSSTERQQVRSPLEVNRATVWPSLTHHLCCRQLAGST